MSVWQRVRESVKLDEEDMSWKKIVLLIVLFYGLLFAWIQRYEIRIIEGKWGAYRLDRWTGWTRVISNNREMDVHYEPLRNEQPTSQTSSKRQPDAGETLTDRVQM